MSDRPIIGATVGTGYDKDKLIPKHKALTFTGAVNATYDGSEAVSVEIPSGGDNYRQLIDFTTTEPVSELKIPVDDIKEVLLNATHIYLRLHIFGDETATDTTGYGDLSCYFHCGWYLGTFFGNKKWIPTAENKSWDSPYINSYIIKHRGNLKKEVVPVITAKDNKNVSLSATLFFFENPASYLVLKGTIPFGTGTTVELYVM